MEQDNDAVLDGFYVQSGYVQAADAMVQMAMDAFAQGRDEAAFYLRAKARELREKGEQESREWEQIRKL